MLKSGQLILVDKKEVKKIMKGFIKIILFIGVLIMMLSVINKNYDNAVENCVKGGNSRQFCEIELSK